MLPPILLPCLFMRDLAPISGEHRKHQRVGILEETLQEDALCCCSTPGRGCLGKGGAVRSPAPGAERLWLKWRTFYNWGAFTLDCNMRWTWFLSGGRITFSQLQLLELYQPVKSWPHEATDTDHVASPNQDLL